MIWRRSNRLPNELLRFYTQSGIAKSEILPEIIFIQLLFMDIYVYEYVELMQSA